MVLLDYPKTTLRLAESDFHTRYLETRLPEELKPKVAAAPPVSVPGIPGATLPSPSSDAAATEALTNQLLRAKAVSNDGANSTPEQVTQASAT